MVFLRYIYDAQYVTLNPDQTCSRRRPPSQGRPRARTPPRPEAPRPRPAMSASQSSLRHVASSTIALSRQRIGDNRQTY